MRLPRTPSGWTVAAFGLIAFLLGVVGLVSPQALLAVLGFPSADVPGRAAGDYTLVFVRTSSMASLNMGVYYLVAAATEWRAFFRFTVYFRALTFAVFTALAVTGAAPTRLLVIAFWEGLGALATALALHHEASRAAVARAG